MQVDNSCLNKSLVSLLPLREVKKEWTKEVVIIVVEMVFVLFRFVFSSYVAVSESFWLS